MPQPKIMQACKGLQVQDSNSGAFTALAFDTDYGPIVIAMDGPQLSLLISMILENANKNAPKKSGHEDITMSFDPITAQGLGVAKGPNEDTAYLSVLMGKVNMTFLLKKTALQASYATMAREIL